MGGTLCEIYNLIFTVNVKLWISQSNTNRIFSIIGDTRSLVTEFKFKLDHQKPIDLQFLKEYFELPLHISAVQTLNQLRTVLACAIKVMES